MKINRLLEITVILLNQGTVTARELAERFDVSTRTIYRDIDVLSGAGVPVYTNRGNGGGVSLLENYTLNRTLISEREIAGMLLALKTLQATKYPEIDRILEKIGSLFKNTRTVDWVDIDFSQWGSKPNENNKFLDVKNAILGTRVIEFDYINAEGEKSRRTVEPMRLLFKGQAWYLRGYCRVRRDFRVFRLSRLKNLSVLAEVFQRREDVDVPKGESNEKEESNEKRKPLVTVKLRFAPEVLYRIFDDFDEELVRKNPDGTCDVTVTLPEDEWVYGYILSYGNFVEVIAPERIRRIVAGKMKKALEKYVGEF